MIKNQRVEKEREKTKGNQSGSREPDRFTFAYKKEEHGCFFILTSLPLSKIKTKKNKI